MSKPTAIEKEKLFDLYKNQRKTQTEIANIYKCSRRTISNWLKKFNIDIHQRLELPINEITNLYVNKKMTTQQIASKYCCNRGCIENRLRNNNIEIKNYRRKYDKYYNQNLSKEQKELILGSMLGDGHVTRATNGKRNCKFGISHCEKQLPYLKWKYNQIKNFVPNNIHEDTHKSSFSKGKRFRFYTIYHKDFNYFRNIFYPNDNKIVSKFKLTPLSLAIWYFDDADKHKISKCTRLHTEGFDINSVKNLSKMLLELNIENKIKKRVWEWEGMKRQGYIITINRVNSDILLNVIHEYHNIPSMKYKVF